MAQTLGTLLIELRAKTDAFERGMKSAKDLSFRTSSDIVGSLEHIGKSLTNLRFNNLDQLGKSMAMVGGIAAATGAALATSVVAIAAETSKKMVEMGHDAEKAGMGIKEFTENAYAAKRSGVGIDEFTAAMSKLAKTAVSAAQGNAQAQQALRLATGTARDATGPLRSTGDILNDIIKKFEKTSDATLKVGLAQQVFGRGGAAMIPFLEKGSKAIEEYRRQADQLGVAFGPESLAAAKQFAGDIIGIKAAGEGAAIQFTSGMLPAVNQVIEALTKVEGHASAMRTFGEEVGSAFRAVANAAYGAYIASKILYEIDVKSPYNIGKKAPTWQTLTGITALKQIFTTDPASEKRVEELRKEYADFLMNLENPTALKVPPEKKSAGTAGLGPAQDINKLISEIQALSNATDTLLAKDDGDKFEQMAIRIRAQLQAISDFLGQHPGVLFPSLNDQARQLGTALNSLSEQQKAILTGAEMQQLNAMADKIGSAPAPTLGATGALQASYKQSEYQKDLNAQNQDALSIYQELQTAGERWAQELTKLNFLEQQGLISQETYNRAIQQARENFSGIVDPAAQYEQEIRRLNDAEAAGLITATEASQARHDAYQREQEDLDRVAMSTQRGAAGATVALRQWLRQSRDWATTMHESVGIALQGFDAGFRNAFSDMIMGTKSVGQAFAEMGRTMLRSVVDALANIVAKWIETKVILATLKLFGIDPGTDNPMAKAQQQIAANTAEASSYAGLAAAEEFEKHIATGDIYGAAAFAAAAYAVGESFATLAAFDYGGIMPKTGVALVHQDEGVLTGPTTKMLTNVNKMVNSMNPATATAGGVHHVSNFNFTINGATDPEAVANKVSDVVMARVKRNFRTAGVSR